ncbi:SOS-induced cell division inhibitor SulA [Serratia microhaemolytica]|uniref:SOS-induced cell division inhibitor SulA n=1 Tax=Serratia microhaemolytica TaxID=2675110 RepID=UPI000FDEC32B|nr:SOS-induced cell division inhibitor SulA [Serratia microhaemolytica]
MRAQFNSRHQFIPVAHSACATIAASCNDKKHGAIWEFVYSQQQPLLHPPLLPLLQQLGQQARWLLWLAPQKRLSRAWLEQVNLPVNKVVQLHQIMSHATVGVMERALLSGNYSVVLGWLPALTEQDRSRLAQAAEQGNAYGFIMRPQQDTLQSTRPDSVNFRASLYH